MSFPINTQIKSIIQSTTKPPLNNNTKARMIPTKLLAAKLLNNLNKLP